MLILLTFLLFLITPITALTPKSEYFNISQQVLDLTWGLDTVTEPRYDLQKYMCKVCDQIVEVAKVYAKNNQVKSGEQLIGFLSDQHYFDEYYETCSRKYIESYAKSGKFLACSTVLEPIVEQLKQMIQQQGANIVKEKKQICYESGLQLCQHKKNVWSILEEKSPTIQKFEKFVYSKYSQIY